MSFDENKKMKEVIFEIDLVFETLEDYTTSKKFTAEEWKSKLQAVGSITKQDETTKTMTYRVENVTLSYLKAVLANDKLTEDYNSLEEAFIKAGYKKNS